jgi:bacterioferritin-associated ferredoxin
MYVCICRDVTEFQLRACIEKGARTTEDIGDACGAGTGCGACLERVDVLLAAALGPGEIVAA